MKATTFFVPYIYLHYDKKLPRLGVNKRFIMIVQIHDIFQGFNAPDFSRPGLHVSPLAPPKILNSLYEHQPADAMGIIFLL